MNPSLFCLVLRARFGLFALTLCATLVAAALVTLLMPKTYQATASLVIEQREAQSLRDGAMAYMSTAERTAYLQTQVEILESPAVARRVVANLKLAEVSRSVIDAARWAEAVNRAGQLRMLSQRLVALAAQRLARTVRGRAHRPRGRRHPALQRARGRHRTASQRAGAARRLVRALRRRGRPALPRAAGRSRSVAAAGLDPLIAARPRSARRDGLIAAAQYARRRADRS